MLRFNTFHFIQFEHFLFEFLRISCETWKIFVIIETNICYIKRIIHHSIRFEINFLKKNK